MWRVPVVFKNKEEEEKCQDAMIIWLACDVEILVPVQYYLDS